MMSNTTASIVLNRTFLSQYSPAIIHYTYYELNFLDIFFIICVFILKFVITSLFIIFALVSINENSYVVLMSKISESYRMISFRSPISLPLSTENTEEVRHPQQNGQNSSDQILFTENHYRRHRKRRDLLYTVAVLNILAGSLSALFDFISDIQRFLFIYSMRDRLRALSWCLQFTCTTKPLSATQTPHHEHHHSTTLAAQNNRDSSSTGIRSSITIETAVAYIDSEECDDAAEKDVEANLEPKPEAGDTISTLPVQPLSVAPPQSMLRVPSVLLPVPEREAIEFPPTVLCRVASISEGSSTVIRAVLDPNSTCSYLSERVVSNLRVPEHFIWPVFLKCCPVKPVKYVYKAASVVLQPLDDSVQTPFGEVQMLVPSGRVCFGHSPIPRPKILNLAKLAGIELSDRGENDAVDAIFGQDLLYSVLLNQKHFKAFLLEPSLVIVRTTFGWTVTGTTWNDRIGDSTDDRLIQFETFCHGVTNPHRRKDKPTGCTDSLKILCCPFQILISILVVSIFILIPYLDAVLYLYNVLYHLAIGFALSQILAIIVAPPITILFALFKWNIRELSAERWKRHFVNVQSLLSIPLLLVYRFFLAGIFVSLYWFLSLGKGLFNQWNYCALERLVAIKFSTHARLVFLHHRQQQSENNDSDGSEAKQSNLEKSDEIIVRLDPRPTSRSTIVRTLLERMIDPASILTLLNFPQWRTLVHVESDIVMLKLQTMRIRPEIAVSIAEMRFRLVDESAALLGATEFDDSKLEPRITVGADMLSEENDGFIESLFKNLFMMRSQPRGLCSGKKRTFFFVQRAANERTHLEHRFYPHSWRLTLTCAYWFEPSHLVYIVFFLAYSTILALIYYFGILAIDLTMISMGPSMFRYIGRFILGSVRWWPS